MFLGAKSCLTLWNPTDSSSPGFSVPAGFPRQEYWNRFHFLLQGIFLTQGRHALAGEFFTTEPPGKPALLIGEIKIKTTMKHFYRLINCKRKAWLTIPRAGKDVEQIELSYTVDRGV